MDYKLILFDVDGTLVKQTSSWLTVHKYFEVEHLASKNLKEYELINDTVWSKIS